MGYSRDSAARAPVAPRQTGPPALCTTAGDQGHYVCQQDQVSVADAPRGLRALADGLRVFRRWRRAGVWARLMTELRQ
jgi:hypothetical protein